MRGNRLTSCKIMHSGDHKLPGSWSPVVLGVGCWLVAMPAVRHSREQLLPRSQITLCLAPGKGRLSVIEGSGHWASKYRCKEAPSSYFTESKLTSSYETSLSDCCWADSDPWGWRRNFEGRMIKNSKTCQGQDNTMATELRTGRRHFSLPTCLHQEITGRHFTLINHQTCTSSHGAVFFLIFL